MNPNIIANAPVSEFDGVFRFTNATSTDFVTYWNNNEYTFKAGTTSPLVIPGETPEGVQNIRKLFAKKLAEREFYAGTEYARLNAMTTNGMPPIFDDKALESMIQSCLEPLPEARAERRELPRESDERFEDKIEAVSEGESLIEKAKSKSSRKKESAIL